MRCTLCPRLCGAERTETAGSGFCRMPAGPVVARAGLHMWEEPCISGTRGSGTVFFSGCTLGCVFCQNHEISAQGVGKPVSVDRLREIFRELIRQGAHNINLVTPGHFAPWVAQALEPSLPVPVVCNTGGYERVETLRLLEGKVQVYLPDGLLVRGVLIRHLVLPGQLDNTRRVIDWVAETFRPGEVLFSLMSQYTPQPGAVGPLARHVTRAEYRAAAAYMENCGIRDGFTQERTSAREEYTPDFDLSGL